MSEWLEEYLISFRGAILMVTHDRYFLDRVATRIVEVDQGKIYNYPGNYSQFVRLKEERQNMALATERKRKSILKTELEWLSRGARARSTKQKAHIDRIKAMQEIRDIQEEKRVAMDSVASRMGNKTIDVYKRQALLLDARNLRYSISMMGIAAGVLFACLLACCIFAAGYRFIRRAAVSYTHLLHDPWNGDRAPQSDLRAGCRAYRAHPCRRPGGGASVGIRRKGYGASAKRRIYAEGSMAL